eukprot:7079448-Pyramimonas_sp.AAC.1
MINIVRQVACWIGSSRTLVGNQDRQPPPVRKPRRRLQQRRRPGHQRPVLTKSQRLHDIRPALARGRRCKYCQRFARTASGRKRLALE